MSAAVVNAVLSGGTSLTVIGLSFASTEYASYGRQHLYASGGRTNLIVVTRSLSGWVQLPNRQMSDIVNGVYDDNVLYSTGVLSSSTWLKFVRIMHAHTCMYACASAMLLAMPLGGAAGSCHRAMPLADAAMPPNDAYGRCLRTMCLRDAYGRCLWAMPMGDAYERCVWAMSMGDAYGRCLWAMPMGDAYGRYLWAMPMGDAYGRCLWAMRLGDASGAMRLGNASRRCVWAICMGNAYR